MRPDTEWLEQYIRSHPEATVDETCRTATEQGVKTSKEQVSGLRLRARQQEGASKPLESFDWKPATPKCSNCGSTHWISECNLPLKGEPVMPSPTPPPAPALVDVGRTFTAAGTARRRQRLNELLDASPGAEPLALQAQLRSEFGVALDVAYIYATCLVAREPHGLEQIPEHDTPERSFSTRASPDRPDLPAAVEAPAEETSLDDELRFLAQQMKDVILAHGLDELRLWTEPGNVFWSYEIKKSGAGRLRIR